MVFCLHFLLPSVCDFSGKQSPANLDIYPRHWKIDLKKATYLLYLSNKWKPQVIKVPYFHRISKYFLYIINHIYAYKVVNQSENALQFIENLTTRSINFSRSTLKATSCKRLKMVIFLKPEINKEVWIYIHVCLPYVIAI